MRPNQGVRYAILGLVSRNPKGVHGYALKRQCDRVLGNFWRLNFGEVYRVLDRLVEQDLIEQVESGSEAGARKVYRITDRGRRSLDSFILEPATDGPRPLRQELSIKLLFATPEQLPDLLAVIRMQRELYARQLQQVETQRRKLARLPYDSFVTTLLIDGAEMSVRSELAWLDEVAMRLKARFAPPSG